MREIELSRSGCSGDQRGPSRAGPRRRSRRRPEAEARRRPGNRFFTSARVPSGSVRIHNELSVIQLRRNTTDASGIGPKSTILLGAHQEMHVEPRVQNVSARKGVLDWDIVPPGPQSFCVCNSVLDNVALTLLINRAKVQT